MCCCYHSASDEIQLGSCGTSRPSSLVTRPSASSSMFLKAESFFVMDFIFDWYLLTSRCARLTLVQGWHAGSLTCIGPCQVVFWRLAICTRGTLDGLHIPQLDSFYSWWDYCQTLWQYFVEIHFVFRSVSYYLTPLEEVASDSIEHPKQSQWASKLTRTALSGPTASCYLKQT